ncbi:MAG: hypothetical protein COA38_20935 [Fluviicola sp.]|nr:MAG: hypothetical protein COA38_20935 [Fluviicola sp.]
MKRRYQLYQTTSKQLMNQSNYVRSITPKGSIQPSRSGSRGRGGVGSLVTDGLRALDNLATGQENAAVLREAERQSDLLPSGEQMTVFIDPVRTGVFTVEGRTNFTKPGNWNGPQIKAPNSKVQRIVVTGKPNRPSERNGRAQNTPRFRELPADANLDRSYRESRDRARDFDRGYDHVSPGRDFGGNHPDTAWA